MSSLHSFELAAADGKMIRGDRADRQGSSDSLHHRISLEALGQQEQGTRTVV